TSTPEFEYDPRIDGDYVVFERHSGDPNLANVILHDLSTGLETQITDLIVHIRIIRISTLEIT
ncbi:MAG: hypothetical protein GY835_22055, partial [bacterium]|nr:hypothetical protein [bacterium]